MMASVEQITTNRRCIFTASFSLIGFGSEGVSSIGASDDFDHTTNSSRFPPSSRAVTTAQFDCKTHSGIPPMEQFASARNAGHQSDAVLIMGIMNVNPPPISSGFASELELTYCSIDGQSDRRFAAHFVGAGGMFFSNPTVYVSRSLARVLESQKANRCMFLPTIYRSC